MDAESLSFMLIALGLLGAHLATVRLLTMCKRELDSRLTANDARAESSSQSLEEIVRIGADVADSLEGIIAGVSASGDAALGVVPAQPSLQDTIIGLMVDKFLGPDNGSQTREEWAVHEEHPTQKNDIISSSAEASPLETETELD